MAETVYVNYGQCGIDKFTNLPIVDDKYFDSHSPYEKCKCIQNMNSTLDALVKTHPSKYKSYLELFKKKYTDNKCDDVFKNYIETNQQQIYTSITQADKTRIEAESIKQRNKRLYVALTVLVLSVGMISIYAKRNS